MDRQLFANGAANSLPWVQGAHRILKYHLGATPEGLQRLTSHGVDIPAPKENLTISHRLKSQEGFPQCGFPGAALADNSNPFAFGNGQADPVHCGPALASPVFIMSVKPDRY